MVCIYFYRSPYNGFIEDITCCVQLAVLIERSRHKEELDSQNIDTAAMYNIVYNDQFTVFCFFLFFCNNYYIWFLSAFFSTKNNEL